MTSIPAPLSDDVNWFPDPRLALTDPDGLLAIGGDLQPERLLNAYRRGIFPWYSDSQPILWWSPDPRAILPLDNLHISRSLAKSLKQKKFEISFDTACADVIAHCAAPRRNEPDTWITKAMSQAYTQLHELGHVHSVEVWHHDNLVGGIYGVVVGRVFCGESMFSQADNASKIALCYLVKHLQRLEFAFIDCQLINPFLTQMGAIEIPRQAFTKILVDTRDKEIPSEAWKVDRQSVSCWRILE